MSTRSASKRGAPEIDRNNIKRTKEADIDEERQDELEDLDDFEDPYHEDEVPSSLPMLHIHDDASFPNDWKRKESAVCLEEDFTFQQIEIDVSSGKPHETMVRGSDPDDTPHIRLFGLTKEGHSVLTHVHGFMPYLYSECPLLPVTQQPAVMWQQPMLPHGMSQQTLKPMSQPPQDQSAASWAMRAQQWAQQRRIHNNNYPQNPPYPPGPGPGPPDDRIPPLAPPQHLPPPGVQSEYMHPPPPPPPNYPPPQPHHKDPHYPPAPYNDYSHEHVLTPHRQPPPPRYPPPPQQQHYGNFQDPHAKSNPQTGQFESPDELHPPHIHQTHWDYTEPPLPHHSSGPFPPHEYSPPSDPVPSPPPPPHEYTYRYVPRHHYQQPYGRNKSEEREADPPPQHDNKQIELAAKRMLGDDSDSDSDNYSSHNRRKRVIEEDSLLTRRVYDPSHVYANTPSEHASRPSQWGTGPPRPPLQSPPHVHHSLPPEQPPQSFDYGHGFPPPVRHHSAQPSPAYPLPSEYPSSPPGAPDLYTQGEEDWAASRRVIPAWLRDDLKKLERDRQKQVEKENMESGRNSDTGGRQDWKEAFEASEMFGPPLPHHLAQNNNSRFFTSEDSRDKFLIEVLQMTVTDFLLEMTSAEIENVCSNALAEVRQSRAKPMVSYDSSTESSIPEEEPREKATPHILDKGRNESPVSSPDRRHKHRSKSNRHHKRGEPSSSSRSKRRSEKSRSYRSRSRSRSPYSRKHKSHYY